MTLRLLVALLLPALAACLPDSGLENTTEVAWSAERAGAFLGSPSIVQCSSFVVASHDTFGNSQGVAHIWRSSDSGSTWAQIGVVKPMYWATLFTLGSQLYLMGTTSDSVASTSEVVIAQSKDCGITWNISVLTSWQHSISTGPTPALIHAGRVWRALERNDGGWASGYAAWVMSAPVTADLMLPASWSWSGFLDFASVAALVPASWSSPLVSSSFGWLEGNAVEPVDGSDSGVHIVLRVNSLPVANKAALLYVANATSTPAFVDWIDLPGGM